MPAIKSAPDSITNKSKLKDKPDQGSFFKLPSGVSQISGYIRQFLAEEFNAGYFFTIAAFLILSLYINYSLDFENSILESYSGQYIYNVYLIIFYAVPFYFSAITYALFYNGKTYLKKPEFWIKSLICFLILTFSETAVYVYKPFIRTAIPEIYFNFVYEFLSEAIYCSLMLLPVFITWYLYDRKDSFLYGMEKKKLDLSIYFIMILIMLPFIVSASFQQSFLNYYPEYRPGASEEAAGLSNWFTYPVFEIFYGMSFISTEVLFRGFLILGLAKLMGRGSVMCMVTLYCYLHFGKPLGEAIGSVFGGFILGVITYYSRSILGGIIVHLGIAWMMDMAAIAQHIFRGTLNN
jgi:hypothetical protein